MENPFEVIDKRLGNLENLLIEIKHDQSFNSALLTIKEAAKEAGVHHNTIRNLIKSGQIEVTLLGAAQRIERKELRKVKKNKVT